jgi:hypothetical protein
MKSPSKALIASSLSLAAGCCGSMGDGCAPPPKTEAPKQIVLVRELARVLRYDCQGSIRSDEIEEVREATRWVDIPSQERFVVDSAEITHLRRPDDLGTLRYQGTSVGFIASALDTDEGLLMDEGQNEIDYVFFRGSGALPERGRIEVFVKFEDRTLQERREIRPAPEACDLPPGPHP